MAGARVAHALAREHAGIDPSTGARWLYRCADCGGIGMDLVSSAAAPLGGVSDHTAKRSRMKCSGEVSVKKIEAIIEPFKLDEVKEALATENIQWSFCNRAENITSSDLKWKGKHYGQ
jgi:hypothetical protein